MKFHAQLFARSPKVRWILAVSVTIFSPFTIIEQVSAQDCSIAALHDAPNSTAAAQANFTCLQSRLLFTLSRIETLEAEIAPFRRAKGLVAAFDRSEEDACPAGWSRFSLASGRMIVGAGVNTNVDKNGKELTDYPSIQDDQSKAVGGEELVVLSVPQMPSHRHPVTSSPPSTNIHDGFGGSANNYGLRPVYDPNVPIQSGWNPTQHPTFMGAVGENQPHSNMPPFIALYFCKKN